jgi:hypothetical protein
VPNLTALILFFAAVALCLWRIPQADRWHVVLCVAAGVIWCVLPMFEPSMRRSGYALVVTGFMVLSLTQPFRRRTSKTL